MGCNVKIYIEINFRSYKLLVFFKKDRRGGYTHHVFANNEYIKSYDFKKGFKQFVIFGCV